MKLLLASLLAIAATSDAPSAAPTPQKFTGTITDSECADANHSRMRMGPTDAECAVACAEEHSASYLLYDGKVAYALSNQKAPAQFAARKVTVTGTLDAKTKTIQVESIAAVK